jgi:hypothetical protein
MVPLGKHEPLQKNHMKKFIFEDALCLACFASSNKYGKFLFA